MQSLEMEADELVQALGIMFLFITGMLAVSLALHGAYHLTNSIGSVADLAPTMAGMWIGQRARRRLSPKTFRTTFLVGMLLVGLPYTEAGLTATRSGGSPYGASHADTGRPELTTEEIALARAARSAAVQLDEKRTAARPVPGGAPRCGSPRACRMARLWAASGS